MRVFLVSSCLLMCACSSQPTPEIPAYERPAAKVSSAWECDPKSAGLWNCSAARAPAAVPASPRFESAADTRTPAAAPAALATAAQPESGAGAASASNNNVNSNNNFVLQVGAFRQHELAVQAVRKIGRPELKIVPTRRSDEDWYVLLLGAYPSAVDAREAGEAYLDDYPKGVIWVRAAADLKAYQVDQ